MTIHWCFFQPVVLDELPNGLWWPGLLDRMTDDAEAKCLRSSERIRLSLELAHRTQNLFAQLTAALLIHFAPAVDPYIEAALAWLHI